MQEKIFIIDPENDPETFQDYLTDREKAQSTIKKYMTDIRTFLNFLDGNYEISKQRILEYKEWLQKSYALSSANSMLASLNQFLIFFGISHMKVQQLKIQKPLMLNENRNLTREDFELLRETACREGKSDLAMIMETIVSTGIRISELQFFTVEAVRKGRAEIHNKGKYRTVLIPQALRRKLLYYTKKHQIEKGSIFVTRTGKPLNRSNIWTRMKKLCKNAGVLAEKVFPHNLRHLFAKSYYQLTRDISGLADILGHSSIEVTRIYTADTEAHYQRQLDRLDFIQGDY